MTNTKQDKKYNGWTNWHTWNVYNHISSHEETWNGAQTCMSPKAVRPATPPGASFNVLSHTYDHNNKIQP